jgi:hypothetical protein
MHPVTTQMRECVWMWPGYDTTHFLVHFTHALSTKHDGFYIPAATPSIKMPLRSPPQSHHSTATLQYSIDVVPIMSMAIGWLLCFLSVCSLIFGYCATPSQTNLSFLPGTQTH